MQAVYTDAESTRASVTLVAGEVALPGVQGPGVFSLSEQATQALVVLGVPIAAYVAPAAPTPTVTGRQIKDQVTAGGYSAGLVAFLAKVGQPGGPKPDDYLYWLGIALNTEIPIDTPKVGRILKGGGVVNADGSSAVPAFMTAAALLTA